MHIHTTKKPVIIPDKLFSKCPNCDSPRIHELSERFLDLVWFSMKCNDCEYTETRDVRIPVGSQEEKAA